MHVVHSPLHARHAGGVELHRGELVPSFESPDRVDHILRAVQAAHLPIIPPRDFAIECLHTVHDLDFSGQGMEYETQYRIEESDYGAFLWQRRQSVPDEYPLAGGIATPLVEGIIALQLEAT